MIHVHVDDFDESAIRQVFHVLEERLRKLVPLSYGMRISMRISTRIVSVMIIIVLVLEIFMDNRGEIILQFLQARRL